jgi:hypothetical protein
MVRDDLKGRLNSWVYSNLGSRELRNEDSPRHERRCGAEMGRMEKVHLTTEVPKEVTGMVGVSGEDVIGK